jgi:predicted methyltransferase
MAIRGARAAGVTDSYKNIAAWGRCISVGVPGGMFPHGFGTEGMQILQTADQVLIVQEKIHDIRIIPLHDHPHVGPNIGLWMGDSRGHWEGDTLVVETTNFHGRGQVASAPAARRLINVPASKSLHVLERFTLVSEDLLQYEVTVDDPEMFSAPWTLVLPWSRNSDFELFEYACHEGNRSIKRMLAVGRARDAAENNPELAALLDNESRPEDDRARDAGRKPLQVLDYLGIEPGMDVMDIMAAGGWYTEVLSLAVGPDGTVVAQNPNWILKMFDGANDKAMDVRLAENRLPNVTRLNDNFGNIGPDDGMYDAAISALNYHDVYFKFGEEVSKEFFDAVYSILRPGGVFAIIDHAAGIDTNNAELHRIDVNIPATFAREAGFIVEENSRLLANPLDSRTKKVFSSGLRGNTDRFILKLRKPAS